MTNLVVGCGFSGATIARKIAEELNEKVVIIAPNAHTLLRGDVYALANSKIFVVCDPTGCHLADSAACFSQQVPPCDRRSGADTGEKYDIGSDQRCHRQADRIRRYPI